MHMVTWSHGVTNQILTGSLLPALGAQPVPSRFPGFPSRFDRRLGVRNEKPVRVQGIVLEKARAPAADQFAVGFIGILWG
jgi:hypothetical protein